MSMNGRMGKAKAAAKWVINTLSWVDYATVVSFSSVAKSATSKLMPMTVENRELLKAYVDTLGATGGTAMDKAFTKAFDVLDSSRASRDSTK
jgi:uncharacterized protein YegL